MKVSDLLYKYAPETDKEAYHGYGTKCYDMLFLPLRDERVKLLEIGVWWGGSVRAWSEYFTWGLIDAVDNEERWTLPQFKELPDQEMFGTVKFHKFNAYDVRMVEQHLGDTTYDIIIDDGPHGLVNQKAALDVYWDRLKLGGLLIIEDIDSKSDAGALNLHREADLILQGNHPQSGLMVWKKI